MNTKRDDTDSQFFEKSWLLSYGDLFTLLFIIITVVASIYYLQIKSNLDTITDLAEQKLAVEEEVQALELQRVSILEQLNTIIEEKEDLRRRAIILDDDLLEMKEKLENMIGNVSTDVTLEETSEGLVVRIKESLLFSSGSASLNKNGQAFIAEIANVIDGLENRIRIEGHTDNVPINKPNFPSNWELSIARSISVMSEFVETFNYSPERFIIAGWGEYKPLVANTTTENRAQNRRVEIVLLNAQLSQ